MLETLQTYLAERGYDMPVDLGGRGSCQIGGMIATNAGGVKVLRYGHMREQVRGLEVVLADGTVVSGLNILKKNNTGLDLKQVFIGSEGTLGGYHPRRAAGTARARGVSDRARRPCPPRPPARPAAGGAGALPPPLLAGVRRRQDRRLRARRKTPTLRIPLDGDHESLVVIEEESAVGRGCGRGLRHRVGEPAGGRVDRDAVVAGSEAQARAIWRVREAPTEAVSRHGLTHKFDVTVPPGVIPAFLGEMEALAEGSTGVRVVLFGHLGDGNVHVNMAQEPGLSDDDFLAMETALADAIYGAVHGRAGSISAEHGIGVMKRAYLAARAHARGDRAHAHPQG